MSSRGSRTSARPSAGLSRQKLPVLVGWLTGTVSLFRGGNPWPPNGAMVGTRPRRDVMPKAKPAPSPPPSHSPDSDEDPVWGNLFNDIGRPAPSRPPPVEPPAKASKPARKPKE